MKTRSHLLKVIPFWLAFTLYMTTLIAVLWLLSSIVKTIFPAAWQFINEQSLLAILCTWAGTLLAVYVCRLIIRLIAGRVEVSIHSDTLSFRWEKQSLFYHRPDMTISFADIQHYQINEFSDYFGLALKGRKNINLHLHQRRKDVRKYGLNFLPDFLQAIAEYNDENPLQQVKEKDRFELKRSGLITGGLLLATFAAIPYLVSHIPASAPTWLITIIGVYYLSAFLFILKIVLARYSGVREQNDAPLLRQIDQLLQGKK